jgi:sigma-B regulation protein RsbU (phosphoserine phosphatase)
MEQSEQNALLSRNPVRDAAIQKQLLVRRERLRAALRDTEKAEHLVGLLHEVDAALERLDSGAFGICETCHDAIEPDRLLVDPLCRNCLDHLSPAEQRALERDLDLASKVQQGLLPRPDLSARGWSGAYHYEPAGSVSGDYCDLLRLEDGTGLFVLGDVTGKGVAASMLMTHLHAIFRSLINSTRRIEDLVANANRIFCEGTVSSFFATLVCGWLRSQGEIETCNAGHCYALHVHDGRVSTVESDGLPLGLFADGHYGCHRLQLAIGDSLVLYSDGLSEAFNRAGETYGLQRLCDLLLQRRAAAPQELIALIREDVTRFRAGGPKTDDLTIMVFRRDA